MNKFILLALVGMASTTSLPALNEVTELSIGDTHNDIEFLTIGMIIILTIILIAILSVFTWFCCIKDDDS